jgi:SAM-dependent methyltransferase
VHAATRLPRTVSRPACEPLVNAASHAFRGAGRFAWHFARGKLRGDPVFSAILEQGLLAGSSRVLDLGCGQGLLAAWLIAARALYAQGTPGGWPSAWPGPPALGSYTGFEINPSEVARGRAALDCLVARGAPTQAAIVEGNITDVNYGRADAIVILDVLHYIDRAGQERVLSKTRAALAPNGRLLLRVGDAAGGFGFALSRAVDLVVAAARRGRVLQLHCRPLTEWQALLARIGFSAQAIPMSSGTPFANVLLLAQPI